MTFHFDPSFLAKEVAACEKRLRAERIGERLQARDHTIWCSNPSEITDRLGWLTLPTAMHAQLGTIEKIVSDARAAGLTRALLLGMGGSSLAADVFSRIFGERIGYLQLRLLDTTHPDAVRTAVAEETALRTLVVVATKSGDTVETISLFRHLYTWLDHELGQTEAQARVVVITDPGSSLDREAHGLGIAHIIYGDPEVGGRYSALSHFGLVPAALAGVDVARLLEVATAEANQPIQDSTALKLAALLGAAEQSGRNKLILRSSATLVSLGAWIEQLIAESTGKDGRGILPADNSTDLSHDLYPPDCVLINHRYGNELAASAADLDNLGYPNAEFTLDSLDEIGAVMYRWEIAAAVASAVIGINPFDQPNVESSKATTLKMVAAYRNTGKLPALAANQDDLILFDTDLTKLATSTALSEKIAAFLRPTTEGIKRYYVSLHAYLSPVLETDAALNCLRWRIQERYGVVTTCGYGPRFLHSTGQLHKGDSGNGIFIQLTADSQFDIPIPDCAGEEISSLSFGVLLEAQALGDRQALLAAGRRVLRINLGTDPVAGLNRLIVNIS